MLTKHSSSILNKSAMLLFANRTSVMGRNVAQYHQMTKMVPLVYQSSPLFKNVPSLQIVQKNYLCAKASDVMQLFEKAKTLVDDKLKSQVNAKMVFCISGKNIVFDAHADRPLSIEVAAEPPKDADCTMIADEKTFMKLAKGETKPTMAFMTGKLKIKGDMKKAQMAEKIFSVLKKEL